MIQFYGKAKPSTMQLDETGFNITSLVYGHCYDTFLMGRI